MKKYISIIFSGLFLIAALHGTAAEASDSLEPGTGSFVYTDYAPLADKPITVWYHIPENKKNAPVFFTMHGNGRNAVGYRDNMLEYAKRYGFILIVPEFSKEQFPNSRDYHQGGVFTRDGNTVAVKDRTFSVIEPLFDYVKSQTGNVNKNYILYGFSAGSQFVHRFMMYVPNNRASRIVSSSAGYYTMPDYEVNYPYGLKNTELPKENIRKFLGRDFTVMVGTADTVYSREDLRKSTEALKQGRDRVARAKKFYAEGKALAAKEGVPFNWKFEMAPAVRHSNKQIAGTVANYLFGNGEGGLIVQGGGTLTEALEEEILKDEFLKLTTVKDPKLLIIPYASGSKSIERRTNYYLDIYKRLGYKDIWVLNLDNPKQALKYIKECDMIWMPGGGQTLLKTRLEKAGLVDDIQKRHKEGVPIGGTSAGAGIMSKVMISSSKKMSGLLLPVMYQGLGLWTEVIVDQHFSERKRSQRLEIAVRNNPELLGVGIDENTATIVTGNEFRVVGANTVTVYRADPGNPDKELEKTVLKAGDVYKFSEN
ncbi:cyanophycinase [Sinomicrobium sp.]